MREHDVTALTARDMERARRELAASLALTRPDSPARTPILAYLTAIDIERTRAPRAPRRSPDRMTSPPRTTRLVTSHLMIMGSSGRYTVVTARDHEPGGADDPERDLRDVHAGRTPPRSTGHSLAGFLAGYSGLTPGPRAGAVPGCELVPAAPPAVVQARRAGTECFADELGARGRACVRPASPGGA